VCPVEFESSEEEDEVDEQVLSKLMCQYSTESSETTATVKLHLADLYSANSNTCLVCISTVRHADPTWSCPTCTSSFHLVCVQKWATDGVKQPCILSEELFPNKEVPWFCPKCRHEFSKKEIPKKYKCYCGRVEDPKYDPWLAPHSCGTKCGAALTPNCGHNCMLLCHPGKCPPCPKQVKSDCYCGRQTNVVRRCGQAQWSCGVSCGLMLQCKEHTCEQTCHQGPCPPCLSTSSQSCRCGKETATRQCLQYDWQCQRVCGAKLLCGEHVCMDVCHAGDCKPCPESQRKLCPCGKTKLSSDLPCWSESPVCDSQCDKALPCGAHTCFKLCHHGKCEECVQVRDKSCRCERIHKVVPCTLELTCESRCNREKECGRHTCRRKCCRGDCPPCDKPCARSLPCRNHKCVVDCHPGRCYPCPEKTQVSCACSKTKVTVACGRERSTRPPKCKGPCEKESLCHHDNQGLHKCHFGNCPSCKQVCCLPMKDCSHSCSAPCHDRVVVSKGPGEPMVERRPCPPCTVKMAISCYGEHELSTMECSKLAPFSCARPCGAPLECGNHTCQRLCHHTDQGCYKCEAECTMPRACSHPCPLPCHTGPCPPCKQYLRLTCHCSVLHLSVKCIEFTGAPASKLATLLSCGSPCTKLLPCKHVCRKDCHLGNCSPTTECKKKVVLYCKCKRQRVDFKCWAVFGKEPENTPICDEACFLEILGTKDQDEDITSKDKVEESRGGRKKKKKQREEIVEPSFISKFFTNYGSTLAGLLVVIIAMLGVYFCALD